LLNLTREAVTIQLVASDTASPRISRAASALLAAALNSPAQSVLVAGAGLTAVVLAALSVLADRLCRSRGGRGRSCARSLTGLDDGGNGGWIGTIAAGAGWLYIRADIGLSS
jgi:hypothetical protein